MWSFVQVAGARRGETGEKRWFSVLGIFRCCVISVPHSHRHSARGVEHSDVVRGTHVKAREGGRDAAGGVYVCVCGCVWGGSHQQSKKA